MGRDKAGLSVHGVTLLDRTIAELRCLSDDLVVVGRTSGRADVRVVPDEIPDSGPVSGLITGLRAARLPLCVVVACDHPFLDAQVLRALAGLAAGFDAVVPQNGPDPQPLHAVYRRGVRPIAEDYFAGGGRSMRGLLDRLSVRWVREEEMTAIDPSGRSVLNVNTPGEWQRLLGLADGDMGHGGNVKGEVTYPWQHRGAAEGRNGVPDG